MTKKCVERNVIERNLSKILEDGAELQLPVHFSSIYALTHIALISSTDPQLIVTTLSPSATDPVLKLLFISKT